MSYQRVLTIQDISCVGQCSMTVALPILSACGVETCILPSAVLSSHTGGFHDPHFRDLTEDMPLITEKWKREGISFDAVYTGYLGSIRQIELVQQILRTMVVTGGKMIVDPAMADHGKLYKGFDEAYALRMRQLCMQADVVIPNITESCMMTDRPYLQDYDQSDVENLIQDLHRMGMKCVVLTGVGFRADQTGVYVSENGAMQYYSHPRVNQSYHGTGDIFASAFVGALMQEKSMFEAVKIAADYTVCCIENTYKSPAHWYGVKFETALPQLMEALR